MRIITWDEVKNLDRIYESNRENVLRLFEEDQYTPYEITALCGTYNAVVFRWLQEAGYKGIVMNRPIPLDIIQGIEDGPLTWTDDRLAFHGGGTVFVTDNLQILGGFLNWFLEEKPRHSGKFSLIDHLQTQVRITYHYHQIFENDSAVQYGPYTRGYDTHRDYIKSNVWKKRSKERRSIGKCEECQRKLRPSELVLHHKTYEHLGAESDEELIVLCRNCHQRRRI